jgi:DNA-binding NarL/FixJ family response regulator
VLFQDLHDLAEVADRAAEAVHLVDHHAIDLFGLDVGKQAAQGRAVHVGSGVAAVVVLVRHERPALAGLAADEGLAGVALRVERVEVLVQALVGRFPRVDGAADRLRRAVAVTPVRHALLLAGGPSHKT